MIWQNEMELNVAYRFKTQTDIIVNITLILLAHWASKSINQSNVRQQWNTSTRANTAIDVSLSLGAGTCRATCQQSDDDYHTIRMA